ncbi:MAG TPA: beta-N-acetylhexosaminidase, partial [Nevskiaceae bacterium]|nr:beta-N-acetylhexosaminidase [Nevskiaceae bacterium]
MGNSTRIGPLMLDVAGLELTPEDAELLAHPLVGGVILFSRNYRDRAQLAALCTGLAQVKKKGPRLLIAVDHEGGRVQRFREGFTRIPPMRTLGTRYETDRGGALAEAEAHGLTIGSELAEFGIDLCFAPVLDRDIGVSGVIGDRAFATDVDTIVELARAFRAGLNRAGRAATGKHFPGHGAVAADSHHELPVDARPLREIERTDLKPFAALVKAGVPSLMMAHVRYT